MKIPFFNIASIYDDNLKNKYVDIFIKQLRNADFILGNELKEFEINIAKYLNSKNFIGVGNGTDALYIGIKSLGLTRNAEVITTPMSYLASTSSIVLNNLKPVFADVDESLTLDIDSVLSNININTKAILTVHLSGNPSHIIKLKDIADKFGLFLIEDCAQSFGSKINDKYLGTFGDIACFSFHPLKILGAVGDAGGIICRDPTRANKIRMMRNHGHTSRDDIFEFNHNMRLDSLKAGLLNIQLEEFNNNLLLRQNQVNLYLTYLNFNDKISPINFNTKISEISFNFLILLVKDRENLIQYLYDKGIETKIHYPNLLSDLSPFKKDASFSYINIPKSRKFVDLIISMPLGNHLKDKDILYICTEINNFYK